MVIVGPKPFIQHEEPKVVEEKWKHGFFNLRKVKAATQNFSSTVIRVVDESDTAATAAAAEQSEELKSRIFNLDQIKVATLDFNPVNQIGKGCAGTVYKGVLPDGNVIAVKQFSSSSDQGIQSYLNEVKTLVNLRHRNIVRLLGSCTEKKQHLLMYEFMENNSLQTSLFGSADLKSRLHWAARIKICLGIAKGLAYLHEDAMPRLVHRDIKLSNILLDKDLNPKICDFGIARPFFEDYDSIAITIVEGTMGYIAPECFHVVDITEKVDVYSFGIVLLELMTGRSIHKMNEGVRLLEYAHNILMHDGDFLELIDTGIHIDMDSTVKQATTVFKLAMLCTNPSSVVRPSMSEVVSILEGRSTIMTNIPIHAPYTVYNHRMASNSDWSKDFTATNNYTIFSSQKGEDKLGDACDIDDGSIINLNVSGVERYTKNDSGSTSEATGNSIIDGEGKDAKSLIKGNVSTPETPKSIDRSSLTAPFEESAKMDDQGNFEGHSVVKLNDSTNEGRKHSNMLVMPSNVASTSEPPRLNENLTTSLSFVDATKMDSEAQLEYFEPLFEEGKLHIECSDKELEEECNKWKDSLVGFFVGEKPPFNVDTTVVKKLWKLKGDVSVFTIGNGYFVFQFNCVEDKVRVLESSGLWHVEQTPLILRKWDRKLKFDKADEMATLPIWVKIYNLPLYLWSPAFLGKVGSGLGIPLYCDEKTMNKKRLDFARVCIEFTATKPLSESFNILVKGVDYKLNLEYDWKPLRCATCSTFGRCTTQCPQKVGRGKNEQCKLEKGSLPVANETLHWDVFEQFYNCACELLSPSDSLRVTISAMVFHTQRDTEIFIVLDDIFYICKPEDLCINNILLYIRLLEDKIMKEGKQHEFGFLNPNVICGGKKNSDVLVSIITQRIQNATTEFIFIPYNQNWHWVLMVIKIDLTKMDIVNIFWLDSLGLEIRYNFKDIMNRVMQCLCIDGNTRNEPTWTIPKVVPKQASNWECGFYVLRYMKEIIEGQPNPVTTTKSFRKHRYKLEDLDEVRLEWIRYIEPYLRIQKCIS